MAGSTGRLAQAVASSHQTSAVPAGLGQQVTCLLGTWIAAETVDANLSHVTVAGQALHFIPKLSGTGVLTVNQTILLGRIGTSWIILGAVLGNTQLATH